VAEDDRVIATSIGLYPLDVALVGYARRHFCPMRNRSAAVRMVIREWAQLRGLDLAQVIAESDADGERVRLIDPEVAATAAPGQ